MSKGFTFFQPDFEFPINRSHALNQSWFRTDGRLNRWVEAFPMFAFILVVSCLTGSPRYSWPPLSPLTYLTAKQTPQLVPGDHTPTHSKEQQFIAHTTSPCCPGGGGWAPGAGWGSRHPQWGSTGCAEAAWHREHTGAGSAALDVGQTSAYTDSNKGNFYSDERL